MTTTPQDKTESREAFDAWYEENVSACFVESQTEYHDAHAVFGRDVKAAWQASRAALCAEAVAELINAAFQVTHKGINNAWETPQLNLSDAIAILKGLAK